MPNTGAVLWTACLQFFVCEQLVRSAWTLPYSFATNYVSDLGATLCSVTVCSPLHALMNFSFVLQGLLIAGGALLSWRKWRGAERISLVLLQISGVGVMIVGFVPEDTIPALHRIGAAFHFLGAGLGMVALGWTRRRVSGFERYFGWFSVVIGIAVLAATLELARGDQTGQLEIGVGAIERVAAYGIAGWMVILGIWSYPRHNMPT